MRGAVKESREAMSAAEDKYGYYQAYQEGDLDKMLSDYVNIKDYRPLPTAQALCLPSHSDYRLFEVKARNRTVREYLDTSPWINYFSAGPEAELEMLPPSDSRDRLADTYKCEDLNWLSSLELPTYAEMCSVQFEIPDEG